MKTLHRPDAARIHRADSWKLSAYAFVPFETHFGELCGFADAPVMVLFGGNPYRRHELLQLIASVGGISAHGALSEEEGTRLLATLPRVDLVLIGGRYSEEQRERIRAHVREHIAATAVTEPGWHYPYANDAIVADVRRKLAL